MVAFNPALLLAEGESAAIASLLLIGQASSPFIQFYTAVLGLMSAPASLPSQAPKCIAMSPDKKYAAVAAGVNVYVYALSSGTPTLTQTLNQTGWGSNTLEVAFSADSTLLAIVAATTSPFLFVYSTSSWTQVATLAGANIPSSNPLCCAFSPNGAKICLGLTSSPFMVEINYPAMTARSAPASLPTANPTGVRYSPNGTYLALQIQGTTNNLVMYTTSTMTLLTAPSTPPTGTNTADGQLAWASDSSAIALATATSPFLWLYTVSGTTITKVANPTILPEGPGVGVAFRSDTLKIFFVQNTATTVFYTFSWNGTTLTHDSTPTQPSFQLAHGIANTI